MDLTVLLEPAVDLPRLAEVLDGLGHEGRLHAVRAWTTRHQAELFEVVKGHRPIDLEFLVPASVGPLVEVLHDGKNTMPAFTHVQKRFVRLPGEPNAIAGYNHQAWSAFSGPGYFVATKGDGELEGEILIDYAKLPSTKPESWPAVRPNEGLIPGIVFGGLTDRLRAVSAHVSIGRAYKARAMDVWFALVRKDVA